jgi:hypothetical protein
MKLRRLNKTGIDLFAAYLDALEDDPTRIPPNSLLEDATTSELIAPTVEVETRRFGSRFNAAEYLDGIFSKAGLSDVDRDIGLWAWLTLFYFDEICPRGRGGERSPGERARYVPEAENFRRYYRHLLAGPYRIYKAHRQNPSRALVILCQQIDKPGDIVEQFASRQEIVTNGVVLEVATRLYVDSETKRQKRNAQSRVRPGTAFRLIDVLNQFDVTWDLYAMIANEMLGVLPEEFEKFEETPA